MIASPGQPGPDDRRPLPGLPGSSPGPAAPGAGLRTSGFAAGQVGDVLVPGPALAYCAAEAWDGGLGGLDDDELAGLLRGWRRLASWAAAGELAAAGEFARRRAADGPRAAEHLDDEIAMLLTLTGRAASRLTGLAGGLARLPATAAALAAGRIDLPRAAVLADETCCLDDDDAVAVEQRVLPGGPRQTTAQLRAAAHRAVLAIDAAAANRRRKRAEKDARVETWTEAAGTAALAGRDLPPADVIAADQRIDALARWLHDQGAEGTLAQLRSRVFTALLNGHTPETLLPRPTPSDDGTRPDPATPPPGGPNPGGPNPGGPAPGGPAPGGPAPGGPAPGGPAPGGPAPGGPARGAGRPGWLSGGNGASAWPAGLGGSVNLTIPLTTWLGLSAEPGEADSLGALDAWTCRDLAGALAASPGSRWCLTLTGPGGRAVAHGCAEAGPPSPGSGQPGITPPRTRPYGGGPPGTGLPDKGPPGTGLPDKGPPGTAPPRSGPPGKGPPESRRTGSRRTGSGPPGSGAGAWLAGIRLTNMAADPCAHPRESPGYRPSAALRHLITIRDRTCFHPSCRRPATRCDYEHTIPFDGGGRTCECNGGPCCRRHHRAKQAPRWHLDQPEPGVFRWSLPSGRQYTAVPGRYPA